MSRRSRSRYGARWDAALAARDPAVLQKVVYAARRKWPNDPEILYHDVVVDMFHGAFDAGARKAFDGLARLDLTVQLRASFLQAYADCLLLARNPATCDIAAKSLTEAERLVPSGLHFLTSRALLALARDDPTEAARLARLAIDKGPADRRDQAHLILVNALLAQNARDGQANVELVAQLRAVIANPVLQPTILYSCSLAAAYSHAGDHEAAVATMRALAPQAEMSDHAATSIRYGLAYVLGRAADPSSLPELDSILAALPPGVPWPAARAHTTALRHIIAGDGAAALAAVDEALEDQDIGFADRAEGLLSRALALDLLGRHAEADADRAEAARVAPHHRLLQPELGAG
jgi:tetratricopeptide (TPR) repeat protein